MIRRLSAIAVLLGLAVACTLRASSQSTTSVVRVNIGLPSEATFYFERTPGVFTDSDALIVWCGSNKAEFITHVGVYNQQEVGQPFDVNCSSSVTHNSIGQRVIHYTVNGTPFTVSLVPQDSDLTVNSASWQSTEMGCGRSGSDCFKDGAGTATVTY